MYELLSSWNIVRAEYWYILSLNVGMSEYLYIIECNKRL